MTFSGWRVLRDGCQEPALNMAVDEALLLACERKPGPPVLRLYGWNPPALSLGCFQKAAEEIELEVCRQRGITVVRRPTGGKAILHDRDLTYSVIAPTEAAPWGGDILQTYRALSAALVSGLRSLGVEAELLPVQKRARRTGSYGGACALVAASHEIVVRGKKLVGSAQKRLRRSFLQHGSIALVAGYETSFKLFRRRAPEGESGRDLWREKTTALEMELSSLPSRAEIEEAILRGFREALGLSLAISFLSAAERSQAEALVRNKYSRAEWNLQSGRGTGP